ncbi:PAS domain S-box protein [Planktothrix pseudagardhii]|uniref:Regulatory protein CysR homolog n=1 Tax=Planktothrix pseudagardhii TaxID=132604 RepID=A0A9W4CT71_9CYAN|nr:PAS domain S-box protein [Planktothrix pseudagardhii]CAD5983608.1 Regulatory protein CysR homolog [Planktothrix pseudagardhii]
MDLNRFSKQVLAMQNRFSTLLQGTEPIKGLTPQLSSTFVMEMGWALEELQVAQEELQQKNMGLAEALEASVHERKRYEDLFYLAPEPYLITTLEGTIQQANRAAAELLGIPEQFIVGKPLSLYIREEDRQCFRSELIRRQERDCFHEWEIGLTCRDGRSLDVACITRINRDRTNKAVSIHWVLRDLTERKRIALLQQSPINSSEQRTIFQENRPLLSYHLGELIPLPQGTLWYVVQGLVKLTTLNHQGQEILMGLIGLGSPFGKELTSLGIYEATACSSVKLVGFTHAEIAASPDLTQLLLTGISYRLHQTEALLALSGERQLATRLYQLLHVLKNEVGTPVDEGICLNIRLTHEELAMACGTTRVTITRLLKQLQDQKKITFNEKRQIILIKNLVPSNPRNL